MKTIRRPADGFVLQSDAVVAVVFYGCVGIVLEVVDAFVHGIGNNLFGLYFLDGDVQLVPEENQNDVDIYPDHQQKN